MTEQKPPIVFKCEASLWEMMAETNPDGHSAKPFDMRRWEIADDRIYRLAWGTYLEEPKQLEPVMLWASIIGYPVPAWVPDEKQVSFLNKATGELLTFEYEGAEFMRWAPGFGFLILGKRLYPAVEDL